MISLVLTMIGADRPGLVDSVASVVREHHGNWLESSMAHLAGQFAGIVRVEVDEQHADQLFQVLSGLDASGLSLTIRKDQSLPRPNVPLVWMDLLGNDRPGIVSEVAHVLARRQVNVEAFQTKCVEAPTTGSTMFHATAGLRLPSELSVQALQADLEAIAMDLMVDIQLERKEAG